MQNFIHPLVLEKNITALSKSMRGNYDSKLKLRVKVIIQVIQFQSLLH